MDWRKKFAADCLSLSLSLSLPPFPIRNLLIAETSSCYSASLPRALAPSPARLRSPTLSSVVDPPTSAEGRILCHSAAELYRRGCVNNEEGARRGIPKPVWKNKALLSMSHSAGYGTTFGLPEWRHDEPTATVHASCHVIPAAV